MKNQKENPVIGIVIPCFNEADVIVQTVESVFQLLNGMKSRGEISKDSFIVAVNDGSRDKTWALIEQLKNRYSFLNGVKLSRNFGHQNALLAGLLIFNDRADCLISIDADLQDDIAVMPEMVSRYKEGAEIVCGVRSKRNNDSLFKLLTAHIFYMIMRILGVKTIYNHADFRLLSRRAINALKEFKEVNLFLRGIVPVLGFDKTVVYYERFKRKAGKTKYPFGKMLSFAWNGITSFSIMPLRMITCVGFFVFSSSLLMSVYTLIMHFLGRTASGWTSIILTLYLLGGLVIFFLGVIGEYIGKTYTEVKNRPRFIVEEEI